MKTKSFLTLLSFCLLFLLPLSLCAQEPVCGKCLKKKSNCPYRCNHPTCKTCGKVCGAKNNACPYGGRHPKCNACGKLKENCAYKGNHPKCNTCGELRENCSYGGNHPTCSSCGKVYGAKNKPCPYNGRHPEPTLSSSGTHAGHEYVDLGLSVKWATCNVGASSPTGYGNYYTWGETSTRSECRGTNRSASDCNLSDIAGNSSCDAARANWGGSWRLPTKAEIGELVNNCNQQWVTINGVAGIRFTSKKNGNSIFFPDAGWRCGTSMYGARGHGRYWSSTPYESNTQYAYNLDFNPGCTAGTWRLYHSNGCSVRPVLE